jgi:carboxyl-terminal processing protease
MLTLRRTCIGLVIALAAFFPASLRAQEETSPAGQTYVVLVGIDKYNDSQIKSRKHAEADAKALYDLFIAKNTLGTSKKNVKLLLGTPDEGRGSEEATRANILKALGWAEKTAKKEDLVIFGFFGNGAPLGEKACYFATDSTFKNRAKDAVAGPDIETILDPLKAHRFVAFIDCNFLGFDAGKETAPDPQLGNFYREFLGAEDTVEGKSDAKPAGTGDRVVFLANKGLKPSLNLGGHGILAEALLEGLSGKADKEGYEPDGNITVGELATYVYKEQHRLAMEKGGSDEEKSQLPFIYPRNGYFDPNKGIVLEGLAQDFIVSHNPTVYPKASERVAAFDKLSKGLEKTLVEEGKNFLERMPKLESQQDLRKAYQSFADKKIDAGELQTKRQSILEQTVVSEKDADAFARTIIRAVKVVRTNYVKDVPQPTLVENAIRGIYGSLNEQIPAAIKEKLDGLKDSSAKEAELVKLLSAVRVQLGKREDLSGGKDITYALHNMLNKLDRHTDYVDPDTLRQLDNDIKGQFSGIGVQIRPNYTKDYLQVVTPISGSPAYKAKIYANDLITGIIREVDSSGKPLAKPETISTKGMTTEEAVKKIIGKEGSKVKLIIEREGEKEPLTFNLIRGKVEVESVAGIKRNSDDSWNYVVDPENKICYVRLQQFSYNTQRDLENVMKKLSKAGIKGFILDLRFNPGGLLDSAVKISDLFIDDGLIVTIRPRNGKESSYVGTSTGSYIAFPMVCLVNGGSASASEIVSACLQDHGRAIVVGSRSYGKGSVQTIQPFPDTGGRLKLTTATFWRPSNRNLNRGTVNGKPAPKEDEWGVTPNDGFVLDLNSKELGELMEHQREQEIIHAPSYKPSESQANFKDKQLEMALDYLRNQIRITKEGAAKKTGE